jgi:hypothetical protein
MENGLPVFEGTDIAEDLLQLFCHLPGVLAHPARVMGIGAHGHDPAAQLVEPAENPDLIPDNKVVVVRFCEQSGIPEKVVCKRLRKQSSTQLILTSDNPAGRIIPFTREDVAWIGVVVKKISEM